MMISLDVFFGYIPIDKADRPDVTAANMAILRISARMISGCPIGVNNIPPVMIRL
jgi:hypothetical protein